VTRRILSDVAAHPWSSAGFVACAVATSLLLADLSSPAMWVLCSVVAAVTAGVVVVTGRKERAL